MACHEAEQGCSNNVAAEVSCKSLGGRERARVTCGSQTGMPEVEQEVARSHPHRSMPPIQKSKGGLTEPGIIDAAFLGALDIDHIGSIAKA